MTRCVLTALLFLLAAGTEAFGDWDPAGARSQAMGGMTAAYSDTWSAENNPAGMAWNGHASAGAWFSDRFLLAELSDKALAGSVPTRLGAFGIAFRHYGFSLYNELSGKFSYARTFGKRLAAGITLEYLRIHTGDEYGNRNIGTFSIGLQYRPGENFLAGVHLVNPIPKNLLHMADPALPTIIRIGLCWTFARNASAGVEAEKASDQNPMFRGGFEYQVVKPLSLRIGVTTAPVTFSFGAGIRAGNLDIDVSSSYNWILGYSPQLSLQYQIGKDVR
jgi:hypothetical protein